MHQEDPLLYRYQVAARRRSPWRALLAWLIYPTLLLSPFIIAQFGQRHWGQRDLAFLAVILHFSYICGRPLLAAVNTLASEKQRGTFDCLATTGFSARQWLSTLFRVNALPRIKEVLAFGWILYAVLPPRISCSPGCYGGVPSSNESAAVFLKLMVLSLACILFYTAAGLWISVRSRSVARAQLNALFLLGSTFFMIVAVDVVVSDRILHCNQPVLSMLTCPWIVALTELEAPRMRFQLVWLAASLLHLGLTGVLLRSARRRLESADSASASRCRPAQPWLSLSQLTTNPIIYRALLQRAYERHVWLRLLSLPALILAMRFGLSQLSQPHHDYEAERLVESGFYLALMIQMFYLTVRTLSSCSGVIAEERETRTWESLMSVPMTLNSFIWGHWVARVLPILGELLLWSGLWLVFTHQFGGPLDFKSFLAVNAYALVWVAFVGALAMFNSSRCSSAGRSIQATVAVLVALGLGTLLADLALSGNDGLLAMFSPVCALLYLSGDHHWSRGILNLGCYAFAAPMLLLFFRESLARQELRFSR